MRVIGACQPPELERTSKPDFSLATARLHVHGDAENPSGWFPDAPAGGALRWSPQREAGPSGQGRQRTAPEPSVTAAPKGAEQGLGALPVPLSMEGKGIAQGQLFTVRGWPFLAGPSGRLPTEGSPLALTCGEAPPAQSSRAAEADAQDTCGWNSKLLVGGRSSGETPRVHCTSPRLHTQL